MIRGNLLVIPIEDSLIYVEPVYLVAEQHDVPQLKRVLVASGDRVAMRRTLDGALAAFFGESPEKRQKPAIEQPAAPALSKARDLIERAQNAMAQGKWDAFGEAMDSLKQLLRPEGSPTNAQDRSAEPSMSEGS